MSQRLLSEEDAAQELTSYLKDGGFAMMITALGWSKRGFVVLAAALVCTSVGIAEAGASSVPGPIANAISPDAAKQSTESPQFKSRSPPHRIQPADTLD